MMSELAMKISDDNSITVDYSNRINYAKEYAESPDQARISEVAESRRGPNQEPNTLFDV